ncbi:E3 ubiquitin-protein ligase RING1-like [Ananas comosus]|uniref:E3 ubiquitin-protein ligase RING1-like n=1 Tax=Ananas comosus TaxID=4615 RepID=A0A6P5H3P2_ANACO|nr:E3 ubiquitin-protein ligase RING1-like [Ananas comosus]
MSSAASHSGDAAAAASSSPPPRRKGNGGANDTFVEDINIPPSEAPRPNPNLGLFFATSCLSTSPASFVLRSRAEADAFFHSPISPLHHLRCLPTGLLPDPLPYIEQRIDYLLAPGTSGAPVYVVLAGVVPPHYSAPSEDEIARLADRINLCGRYHDTFITSAARRAVAALRDVEIDAGPQGGQSCTVCQETLAIGTVAASFPCTHVFHRNCIVPWLQQQHTCPVCRFSPLMEEMIGPSHSVFRVVIPPPSLGLDLNEHIVVMEEKMRGNPEIPPRRWA